MDKNKDYTIEEASRILNTSVYTVRRRIKENKLKAELVFGRYLIQGKDLYDFMNKKSDFIYFNSNGDLKSDYKFIFYNQQVLEEHLNNILEEIYFLAIKKEIMFRFTSDLAIIYMKYYDKIFSMCSEEEKNLIVR